MRGTLHPPLPQPGRTRRSGTTSAWGKRLRSVLRAHERDEVFLGGGRDGRAWTAHSCWGHSTHGRGGGAQEKAPMTLKAGDNAKEAEAARQHQRERGDGCRWMPQTDTTDDAQNKAHTQTNQARTQRRRRRRRWTPREHGQEGSKKPAPTQHVPHHPWTVPTHAAASPPRHRGPWRRHQSPRPQAQRQRAGRRQWSPHGSPPVTHAWPAQRRSTNTARPGDKQ